MFRNLRPNGIGGGRAAVVGQGQPILPYHLHRVHVCHQQTRLDLCEDRAYLIGRRTSGGTCMHVLHGTTEGVRVDHGLRWRQGADVPHHRAKLDT